MEIVFSNKAFKMLAANPLEYIINLNEYSNDDRRSHNLSSSIDMPNLIFFPQSATSIQMPKKEVEFDEPLTENIGRRIRSSKHIEIVRSLSETKNTFKDMFTNIFDSYFKNSVGKNIFPPRQIQISSRFLLMDKNNANKLFYLKIEPVNINEDKLLMLILNPYDNEFAIEEIKAFQTKFFYSLSHEMRTPLNSSMILLKKGKNMIPQNTKKTFLSPALKALKLLLNVINDLIDYSKILSNRFETDIKPYNIQKVIWKSVKILNSNFKSKKIDVQ